jgi:hypothetical protein
MCCNCSSGFTRREMLMAAAAGTAVMGGSMMLGAAKAADAEQIARGTDDMPEVRVCYLRPKAKYWLGWPGTSWDPEGFLTESTQKITKLAKELRIKVVFEPEPLYENTDVEAFIAKLKADKPQGVLVFPLHMERWPHVDAIAKVGVPTVIFAGLGTCFTAHIQQISRYPGVYLASTADFDLGSVRYGLKMIRTRWDVQHSKIAVLVGNEVKEQVLNPFGLTVRFVPRDHFVEVLKTIEENDEVRGVAEEYRKNAKKTVEPSEQDVINASKNYFTALKIMKEHGCNGISMECLGLVKEKKIASPPCMAWSKLLDVGIPGVCEADIKAVMGHTLCCKLLDKPGFMQDPVPDTVKNTFIGAHCVSPTRLDGYDKPRAPFMLRSHSESNVGVSLQVIWEPGREVTIMQFADPGTIMLGKGKILRNLDTPPCGGCRTSVELAIDAPADTRDTKGFHQLFIMGDHVRDFQAYAQMFGLKTEHV